MTQNNVYRSHDPAENNVDGSRNGQWADPSSPEHHWGEWMSVSEWMGCIIGILLGLVDVWLCLRLNSGLVHKNVFYERPCTQLQHHFPRLSPNWLSLNLQCFLPLLWALSPSTSTHRHYIENYIYFIPFLLTWLEKRNSIFHGKQLDRSQQKF